MEKRGNGVRTESVSWETGTLGFTGKLTHPSATLLAGWAPAVRARRRGHCGNHWSSGPVAPCSQRTSITAATAVTWAVESRGVLVNTSALCLAPRGEALSPLPLAKLHQWGRGGASPDRSLKVQKQPVERREPHALTSTQGPGLPLPPFLLRVHITHLVSQSRGVYFPNRNKQK